MFIYLHEMYEEICIARFNNVSDSYLRFVTNPC